MAAGNLSLAGARHGMTHPVLDMQRALNNGGVDMDSGVAYEAHEFIDSTPRVVAAFVLGSAVLLFLLKRAGFRFNFGVGANIGK